MRYSGSETYFFLYVSMCVLVSQSCLFATLKTVARQAPLSMDFSRQEQWSGLPLPSPGDLPNPEIKLRSPELQADSLLVDLRGKPLLINSEATNSWYIPRMPRSL